MNDKPFFTSHFSDLSSDMVKLPYELVIIKIKQTNKKMWISKKNNKTKQILPSRHKSTACEKKWNKNDETNKKNIWTLILAELSGIDDDTKANEEDNVSW